MTTNWAVVTTAAAISFAFSGTEPERHVVILLISVLVTFFLLLEARRYRHYDIWQTQVHLLESDFFAPMLSGDDTPRSTHWREVLAQDLRQPHYYISFGEALGWRLRRNYAWLYATHVLTWLVKIIIHPGPIHSLDDFMARAAVGPIPGWAMILLGVGFNLAVVGAAVLTWGEHTTAGEVAAVAPPEDKLHDREKAA